MDDVMNEVGIYYIHTITQHHTVFKPNQEEEKTQEVYKKPMDFISENSYINLGHPPEHKQNLV